jgi:hypothetical protein
MNKKIILIIALSLLVISSTISLKAEDIENESVRFAVISDMEGYGLSGTNKALDFLNTLDNKADYIFVNGDWGNSNIIEDAITDRGWDKDQIFFILGNHEMSSFGDTYFKENLAPTYPSEESPSYINKTYPGTVFSFTECNAHFVITNQYWNYSIGGYCSDQIEWLNDILGKYDGHQHFVFGHEPFFPHNRHVGGSLDATSEYKDVWDILVKNNVSLFIHGHTHFSEIYEKDGFLVQGNCVQLSSGCTRGIAYHNPVISVPIIDVYSNGSCYVDYYESYNNRDFEQFDLEYQNLYHSDDENGNKPAPFWISKNISFNDTVNDDEDSNNTDEQNTTFEEIVDNNPNKSNMKKPSSYNNIYYVIFFVILFILIIFFFRKKLYKK